jgi:hypothetical protein
MEEIKNDEKMEEVKNDKEVESIKEDKIDPQKVAEIVEEEKKTRVAQCGQEIVTALKKYNCDFDISMILKSGSVIPNIQIIAK